MTTRCIHFRADDRERCSNLQDTATSIQGVVNNVSAGQGTIGKLLTDETLYRATTSSMTNLNSILIKVNQGQGTVGKLVNDQDFTRTPSSRCRSSTRRRTAWKTPAR
jgi:hypothetical protein